MMSFNRSAVLVPVAVLMTMGNVGVAHAQAELVTDRPDQTESAEVVPRRSIQVETGLARSRESQGGLKITVDQALATLVRIGLLEELELRVGWGGWIEQEAKTGGSRQRVDGAADGDLGVKYLLFRERGRRPQTAILASTSLPIGESDLSSDRPDPAVRLSFAHTLSETVGLGYNLGLAWSSEELGGRTTTTSSTLYTVAAGFSLTSKVGAFAELYGEVPSSSRGRTTHSADAGLTFLLSPRVQLDVAAGLGLNDAAADGFVGVGVSWRWDPPPFESRAID